MRKAGKRVGISILEARAVSQRFCTVGSCGDCEKLTFRQCADGAAGLAP